MRWKLTVELKTEIMDQLPHCVGDATQLETSSFGDKRLLRNEVQRFAGVAHKCGISARVPTLVNGNESCFVLGLYHHYTRSQFDHVQIQNWTVAQPDLQEPFHGTLKDREVYWNLYVSTIDVHRTLAYMTHYSQIHSHRALQPTSGGEFLVPAEVSLDKLAVTNSKWQGWVRIVRKNLLRMTRELSNPIWFESKEISFEKSIDTQIKSLNPCFAK